MLAFTVYGEAQPQGSAKAFVPRGWSRPIVTSDNPSLKQWRQVVAEAANHALGALPAADRDVLQAGVRVTVAFYLPRPKSLPKKTTAHTKKPDLDKLVRSCCDALTAIVFRDDSQVCELVAAKHYASGRFTTAGTAPIQVPAVPLPLFAEAR